MQLKRTGLAIAALAVSVAAHAQLAIITNTSSTTLSRMMYYDLATGTTTNLFTGSGNTNGYGIAADDANGKLWYATGARIGSANYGAAPLAPAASIGNYYSDQTTIAQTWELTMANGSLYTWNKGSTTFVRGIYQVSAAPVNSRWILSQVWSDSPTTGNQYEFQGLTYRSQDGLFYGVNTIADHTMGLYSIDAFGNDSVNFIAPLPTGHTHVDGLTVSADGTKMYMTEQSPTDAKIYIFAYDVATATYGATYTIAYADATQRGTGVTWAPNVFTAVPEPATMAVVGLGCIAVLRRRKKK